MVCVYLHFVVKMHMVKSQQTVCWLRACLTWKVMTMQQNQILRLNFLFVTRNPKVQNITFDFEEYFRSFGCRKEVRLHNLSELATCYCSSITLYFSISMLLTQIS